MTAPWLAMLAHTVDADGALLQTHAGATVLVAAVGALGWALAIGFALFWWSAEDDVEKLRARVRDLQARLAARPSYTMSEILRQQASFDRWIADALAKSLGRAEPDRAGPETAPAYELAPEVAPA